MSNGINNASKLRDLDLILPNVAALVAYSGAATLVRVLGYYAAGDGGGGLYFKNAAPTLPADGGAMILSTSGSYWQLTQTAPVSLRQYGAKGDGVTDDTAAVQKFINYAITTRRGHVPATNASYRLTAPIEVVGSLYISGDGCVPYQAPAFGTVHTRGRGAWFFLDHVGIGFNLKNVQETTEVIFEGVGTVRPHAVPAAGWQPTVSDYDFACSQANGDYTFRNLYLLNPYKGIFGNGRCTYDNVRGQPLKEGIRSNLCADTNHFRGIHWWPYWSDQADVKAYQLANTVGFFMLRVDNATMQDCFTLWHRAFMQVAEGANGSVSKLRILNCDGDAGVFFLYVDSSVVNGASIQIANCVSQGESSESIGIFIAGKNCRINVANYVASQCALNAVRIDGTPSRVTLANFRADSWNTGNAGFPAIEAAAGNVVRIEGTFDYDGGNNALLLSGAAQYIGHIGGGMFSGTTDAAGIVTVVHNLKANPARVGAQLVAPDSNIGLRINSVNNNAFTVKCSNGAAAFANSAVQFSWEAWNVN